MRVMFSHYNLPYCAPDILAQLAAQNPWSFLYYVLLGLSPFFLMSIVLSIKLAKALEAQEKENKRKVKREASIAKARRVKAD